MISKDTNIVFPMCQLIKITDLDIIMLYADVQTVLHFCCSLSYKSVSTKLILAVIVVVMMILLYVHTISVVFDNLLRCKVDNCCFPRYIKFA